MVGPEPSESSSLRRKMAGIYVHLPFCPYVCPYCDFAKWPYRRSAASAYLEALCAEIRRPRAPAASYGTVFLGGGTPNTYEAGEVTRLLDLLRDRMPGPRDRETTIEANPELIHPEQLRAYARSGVNRLSIGVQSFVPEEVRTLGRRHTCADVRAAVASARDAGIRSVSLDLIFGTPGQTVESWRRSLAEAIALNVDHISAYGLTVEAGTPYECWREREPQAFLSEDAEADLYDTAMEQLEAAGYEQYEISNFARSGHRSAHNANYWANGEYAGFGVGAASYLDGVRSVHTRDLDAYVKAAAGGAPIPSESEHLEGVRRAGEAVMLALRTSQGVRFEAFKERYGVDFLTFYAPVVRRYCADGLLEVDEARARLSRRGRFVANDVCAAFVTFA
jgi:oxygen-independent coproporphyrinogen-3 oxidase